MANKSLFASIVGKLIPATNARNHEGAPAYELTPKAALAQLAVTGTFNGTFYADARTQLTDVLALAAEVEPEYLAKVAVYAAESGYMKDMPATLLALLSTLPGDAFSRAFPAIVKNGKMLRTFVQVMRSGAIGRKSLGSRPKRLVEAWLETASDVTIMRSSVGNDPSLADVIRMVHPKPATESRRALYAYLIGKPYDVAALPAVAAEFEAFKRDPSGSVPNVPFQMLTSLDLSPSQQMEIARQSGWQMLRQNLNTFERQCLFADEGFTTWLASRLRDEEAVRKARVFPYQIMATYSALAEGVPAEIREALQDAMEIALRNVPDFAGRVVVCPDVSGSMASPVTGYRQGATTKVRCIDVAALVAAAVLRKNPRARVLPFERDVVNVALNPRDTVLTNAAKLAAIGGGGTNCSAPLARLNGEKAAVDLVIFVSDNESWVDQNAMRGTAMMAEWQMLKRRNPSAKLVAIDIQPYRTSQVTDGADILNIGGFSDRVFEVIAEFVNGAGPDRFVKRIEAVDL